MLTTDRRRVGGIAAVVAAFWLGFTCGGGGSSPGVAVSFAPPGQPDPAAQPPEEPAPAADEPDPASQPPEEPAPAAEEPDPAAQPPDGPAPAAEEPDPASQPPDGPAPARDEPSQADTVPEGESSQADPVADETTTEGAETDATTAPEPPLVQDRPREFTARTGMVLYFVSPGGESAFEETMGRVAEAFAASESEERQQQAEGWSTYKAEEPLADGVILYVSWLDPAVPGADYWVPGILNEAFPTEAQTLYETYAGAFADGQILLNLVPVAGP